MKARHAIPAIALVALSLAGCSKQPAADDEAVEFTLNEVMKNQIDKHADELWDVSNAAIGADAGIDPALMDDERWAEIARLAGEVQAGATQLAALDPIVVVRPGVKIADEDAPYGDSAADVQAGIDKNPQMLRDFANALGVHMGDLVKAAQEKDAARAGQLINQLDGVCEDCHVEFWYPSQKELIEKFRNE